MVTQAQAARIEALVRVTDIEAKARRVIAEARVLRDDNVRETVILNVFDSQWAHALTLRRITDIARALSSIYVLKEDDIRLGLTRLVRGGVLRSRTERGERLWELAL